MLVFPPQSGKVVAGVLSISKLLNHIFVFPKKIIKICLVLFWFCPPQSGAPNFRPPGRQTQTQVRNFNAISRSPAGFVKVPFVSPAPYKPPQKTKKIIVFCDALSSKKCYFFAYCALNLCFCTCVSGLSCRCIFTTSNFSISSASKCSIKAGWRGRPLIVNQLFQLTNSKLYNSVE